MTAEGGMIDASSPSLRDVRRGDLARVETLNAAAIPHVNGIPHDLFDLFRRQAAYFRVAERDSEVIGFLVALTPEADYASPNFLWFRERYESFLYIDRIVVDVAARGTGLGTRFYRDLERVARDLGIPRLTCEVNLRPPNEASLRFHERFGFEQVGRQETGGGAKEVSLLAYPVPDRGS